MSDQGPLSSSIHRSPAAQVGFARNGELKPLTRRWAMYISVPKVSCVEDCLLGLPCSTCVGPVNAMDWRGFNGLYGTLAIDNMPALLKPDASGWEGGVPDVKKVPRPFLVVRTSVGTERYGAASMYSQLRGSVFTPNRSYTCSAASTRAWLRIPSVMSGRSGMGGIAFST